MTNTPLVTRLLAGAAAGLVNTFALQGVRTANQRFLPDTMPPMKQDPGQYLVDRAKAPLSTTSRRKLSPKVEAGAAGGLHLAYGATFGLLYGLAGPRGRAGRVLGGGAMLGLATWAAGYLGWLPAAGLMPPLREQEPKQIVGPIVSHLLFGIGTAAGYDLLRGWLDDWATPVRHRAGAGKNPRGGPAAVQGRDVRPGRSARCANGVPRSASPLTVSLWSPA